MRSRPPRLTLRKNMQSSWVTSLHMHTPGTLGPSRTSCSRITPCCASVSASASCRYLFSCVRECTQHLMFIRSPRVSHESGQDRCCWPTIILSEEDEHFLSGSKCVFLGSYHPGTTGTQRSSLKISYN